MEQATQTRARAGGAYIQNRWRKQTSHGHTNFIPRYGGSVCGGGGAIGAFFLDVVLCVQHGVQASAFACTRRRWWWWLRCVFIGPGSCVLSITSTCSITKRDFWDLSSWVWCSCVLRMLMGISLVSTYSTVSTPSSLPFRLYSPLPCLEDPVESLMRQFHPQERRRVGRHRPRHRRPDAGEKRLEAATPP